MQCVPLILVRSRDESFPCSPHLTARRSFWRGLDDGEAVGGLVRACNLDLFPAIGGFEEIGEVGFRVLGADLHEFRVRRRGGGVNGIVWGWGWASTLFPTRSQRARKDGAPGSG